MSDVLRGNFKTKKQIVIKEQKDDLSTQFEKEALKKLGGSIAFVSKKQFLYGTGKEEK